MSNAELAILSLIVEQPRYGYEIEQVIEKRGMRDWTEVGFSSIYYLLNKLEKKNLIRGEIEQPAGRGPARKVYQATAEGIDACQRATIEALASPQQCFPAIQLGLANMYQISRPETLDALRRHRDSLGKQITNTIDRRESQRPFPEIVEYMFDYSLTMAEAERNWLDNLINHLEEQEQN